MPRWRRARIPAACSGSNNPVFRSRGNRFAFRGGGPVFCFVENPGKTDFFRRILGDLEPLPCVAWSRFSCVTWFRFPGVRGPVPLRGLVPVFLRDVVPVSRRTRPGSSAWPGPGFPGVRGPVPLRGLVPFSLRTRPGSSAWLGPGFPGVRGPVPLRGLVPVSRRTRPGSSAWLGPGFPGVRGPEPFISPDLAFSASSIQLFFAYFLFTEKRK